ncbi:CoA ester lyase [Aneurinibacillus sp. Ricciae_BoGa-3]|uniref:HpcH/HpaI aldolase/citrate lyase family protein n=1 Tax=Aneurinibacillus sp. Ricciae_BoGa-3 TaxID=3022697 RepID=UPI00233F7BD7|nr:CoA ester lyase [Aneurinibacillus sp. Ricciae_BoGa-3]WCK56351.1 CoA ester lyase [Aneurinibacillus sp. Ricciae_BoGa-3]
MKKKQLMTGVNRVLFRGGKGEVPMHVLRSWLFVPGSDSKKIEKARESLADVVIFDLEDAVSVNEKSSARNKVKEAVNTRDGKLKYVRVNSFFTPFLIEDINSIVGEGLAGIILPKSENKEQLLLIDYLMNQLERNKNLKQKIEIMPLIESACGIYNAYEIARSCDRIQRLAFGSVDFALDINAELTEDGNELLYARSQLVIASRAAGIEPPIDAVYLNIKDTGGLWKETRFVKQLGFQGKLVIHPNQIQTVNEVFVPSLQEIEESQIIVEAYGKALSEGIGVVQVKGKMVDVPVIERAKKIIEKSEFLSSLIK